MTNMINQTNLLVKKDIKTHRKYNAYVFFN